MRAPIDQPEVVGSRPPSGPTPKTPDGKPDFTGVYYGVPRPRTPQPELLPWAAEIAKRNNENNQTDSPAALCLPGGPLKLASMLKVVQTPQLIVLMVEEETPGYRQIFLDGRGHPENFNPSWYEHSTGKWEGDTLVVETVGFNDRGRLNAAPQSEQMRLIERFRRPDLGHLEIEEVVEDSKVLAKPWKINRVANLAPGEEIMEFICNENNRDPQHMVGK